MTEMLCPECSGEGYTWYGNHTTYAVCEICGGFGYINHDGTQTNMARPTPLWPVHDQNALDRKRNK